MLVADKAVVESVPGSARSAVAHPWLVWSIAVLPFTILAIWRAAHGVGDGSDDYGQYLMHAQALAEGRPYGDIGYIYSRYSPWIGPPLAPPGLPVTLAPLLALFGANMLLLQGFMLLFSIGFVLLAGLYFARTEDWKLGLGVCVVCGLSPAILLNATQVLTDLPFAAIVWLLIHVIDRPGVFSWRRILLVTVLGAYAVAFRPVGLTLVLALLLYTALRYKQNGLKPAVPVFIWMGGLLVLSIIRNIDQTALITLNPVAVLEWIFVEKLFLLNLKDYVSATAVSHTYPFDLPALNDAFHAVTFSLMFLGLFVWLRKSYRQFSVAFGVCYFFLLVIMPLSQSRYLWPLFPFFVFGLLNGIRLVLVRWRPTLGSTGALAFAVALVPAATIGVATAPRTPHTVDMPQVREIIGYLEHRPDHDDLRVTFFKPRTLAWETGVAAMGPPRGDPVCLIRELEAQRITHVVAGSIGGGKNSDLRRTIAVWPERFAKEMENRTFTVYRFVPDAAPVFSGIEPDC